MSESKRSPVKRKLIFGSVVAVAMVLVLSAVGLYALVIDPDLVDQIRSAVLRKRAQGYQRPGKGRIYR